MFDYHIIKLIDETNIKKEYFFDTNSFSDIYVDVAFKKKATISLISPHEIHLSLLYEVIYPNEPSYDFLPENVEEKEEIVFKKPYFHIINDEYISIDMNGSFSVILSRFIDFERTKVEKELDKHREKNGLGIIFYEHFKDYLQQLNTNKAYVTASQAIGFSVPVKKDEEPIAYRTTSYGNIVPLYDRTGCFTVITTKDWKEDYGLYNDVQALGGKVTDKDVIGYHLKQGHFEKVYDLSSFKQHHTLFKKGEVKFPLIREEHLLFETGLQKALQSCPNAFVGYYDGKRKQQVFDLSILASLNQWILLSKSKKDTLLLPYCTDIFISILLRNLQPTPSCIVGIAEGKQGAFLVYDFKQFCIQHGLIKTQPFVNEHEVFISFDEFERLNTAIRAKGLNFGRHVKFTHLTDQGFMVFKGPKNGHWLTIREEFLK